MKQVIRWSGLLGFVVVIGLLAAFFILFSSSLLKMGIEYGGSKMVGAKVELESVDLSFSPLGFGLNNLQVTNAEKPMENIIQIERTQANLELGPLFQSKFMMSDLNVKDMRFNTQRQSSGEIKKQHSKKESAEEKKDDLVASAAKKLPSTDEMLAREPLKTVKAGEELKQSYNTGMAEVDKAFNNLPSSSKADEYQKRVEELLNKPINSLEEFQQRKKQLDALKKEIQADKKAIVTAKETLDNTQKDVREKFKALKQAPGEDYRHIASKYSMNAQGVAELTGLLLGPKIGNYAKQGLYWYNRLRPYLASALESSPEEKETSPARLVGRYVHFPTANPWVSFLIRKAELSASVPQGEFAINLKNITNEQVILQRPSKLSIDAKNLQKIKSINANLVLDYRKAPYKETFNMDIKNWYLDKLNLGVSGINLASARMNSKVDATVVDKKIQSTLLSNFYSTKFTNQATTQVAKELGKALKSINSFNLNAQAKGDLESPEVSLDSNLEQKASTAISNRLNAKKKQIEKELKVKLENKMLEYAGPYKDKLRQLDIKKGNLSSQLNKLEKLAKSELEDYKKQQERKARQEAEAKRNAEEERLKKEAEAKRKAEEEKLKNQAKDKLKSLF